jgi:KDO2-lipid IV(A) lauroyltransferase
MIVLLELLSRLLAVLPRPAALAFGRGLGWVLSTVIRHRRHYVLETLAHCLPDRTPAEHRRIYRQMFRHLGMTVVEQMRVTIHGLDRIQGVITIHGEHHLQQIMEQRKHALALMAHIGNWEICGFMTQHMNQPVSVVVKPMRNRKFDVYLTRSRERMGLDLLPATSSYWECIKRLRQRELLAMILDQNTVADRGIFVDFFGRSACTTPGLAILSAQSQASVFPLFAIRREDLGYDLYILDPIEPPPDRTPETLRSYTQKYTQAIEEIIRRHPEQWIWLHRRWKTRPGPEEPT